MILKNKIKLNKMKTTKKRLVLILLLIVSITGFSQKNEMKAASKALAKSNFTEASAQLSKVRGMLDNLDDKTKAKFYFMEAKVYNATGKVDDAVKALKTLMEFEKQIGKPKYTKEAKPMLENLVKSFREKGIKEYQDGKWDLAKVTLEKVFILSPQDTVFLQYAGGAALKAKDYDLAIKDFQKLLDLGYKGVTTNYTAVNTKTGERENLGSKNYMDLMVKSGQYKEPKVEKAGPVTASLYNNLASAYLAKKDVKKAQEAIEKAKQEDPNNINVILTQASIEYELGNKAKFTELMKEAVKLQPDNPSLFFNIGVVSMDQGKADEAIAAYKRAIELKPDYSDAWLNLAYAEIADDKNLVEEMEANINDFDKFDEIKAKQLAMYRKALPTFEKALQYNQNRTDFMKTVMALYENLEMYDKQKALKEKIDAIENK
jgi:tetratricopeptide (TPR) repeat protein